MRKVPILKIRTFYQLRQHIGNITTRNLRKPLLNQQLSNTLLFLMQNDRIELESINGLVNGVVQFL